MVPKRLPYICPPCFRRCYTSTATINETILPSHPPNSGTTRLTPTRRLIMIHGIDAPKYLQGVTTTNIPLLTDHRGAYSAFLTAQGRVLFDVFIYPINHSPRWRATSKAPEDPGFFIEYDAESTPSLLSHIKRYKLRSKFTVRALEPGEWDVWSVWDTKSLIHHKGEIGSLDNRAPDFGKRLVLPDGKRPEVEFDEVGPDSYMIRRILHGVPEGQQEILGGSALPGESNMDYMGGIDFRKGCYVGQELTIRTHHRGVVRKRILPVQVYPLDEETQPEVLTYDPTIPIPLPPQQTNISRVGKKSRSAGKYLTGVGNIGLALCRLEIMTDVKLDAKGETGYRPDDEFQVEWEVEGEAGGSLEGVKVKAFAPGWHGLGNQSSSAKAPVSNSPYSEAE
ncbi:ccr4 associated factor [Rhizina undulata]